MWAWYWLNYIVGCVHLSVVKVCSRLSPCRGWRLGLSRSITTITIHWCMCLFILAEDMIGRWLHSKIIPIPLYRQTCRLQLVGDRPQSWPSQEYHPSILHSKGFEVLQILEAYSVGPILLKVCLNLQSLQEHHLPSCTSQNVCRTYHYFCNSAWFVLFMPAQLLYGILRSVFFVSSFLSGCTAQSHNLFIDLKEHWLTLADSGVKVLVRLTGIEGHNHQLLKPASIIVNGTFCTSDPGWKHGRINRCFTFQHFSWLFLLCNNFIGCGYSSREHFSDLFPLQWTTLPVV